MCEHLASFREGYLPSESAQHATKHKNHFESHLHPDSASFELLFALKYKIDSIKKKKKRNDKKRKKII